ncbi:IS21 family transposase [Bacillus bingmayongensis]|uniref:IS21 family transposase n=1 Tax=Bacillus bingmayongensis TaxID=1150157 RepID=UPI001C8E0F76|nr:IS21 family transposase [Bacillus bingmayongensis]MBY0595224.1 IS21 family transposase [Bacillus bingmayongensis]
MIRYREILRLHSQGVSQRGIASSCSHSRNTVNEVLKRAQTHGISWPFENDISDGELQELLFPEKNAISNFRRKPDCEYVHKELAKSGVTLSLLWDEYCLNSRANQEIPYSYRQFCRFYHEYATKTKATMRIKRKPGELLEVDWAGQTMHMKDNITGEEIPVYVFVSALPYSQYAYVEGFLSMDTENWITAHIHAFQFYGGVTRIIVPDNLKTGVVKASRTDPVINRTYQELAEYYQTSVIPARVRHPKDKSSAEGTVGNISTWIIASLRHQQFFSLTELNQAIQGKLMEFNTKEFQKRPGNRLTAFMEEEKFALLPLPVSPYEIATWKKATVQYDYHINLDKMYYSVPYDYIKHQVDIRITRQIIESFYKNFRIASHKRLHGKEGQIATNPDHMPKKHKQFIDFNRETVLDWAGASGTHILITVTSILASYKTEKQGLKSSLGLMKLADKYSIESVEKACERALSYTPRPTLKSIQTILKTGQDRLPSNDISNGESKEQTRNTFGFIRGADYYGGNDNDK